MAFAEQKNGVLIKPKRMVDPEDTLSPAEAKIVRCETCAFALNFLLKPKRCFHINSFPEQQDRDRANKPAEGALDRFRGLAKVKVNS